ncbi:hypothetical protein E2I00_001166, partial [Balaenoptera physalus]
MSDQGAGTRPIKSCQLGKQVGAWWTVARHRGNEMARRVVSGLLLCGVAAVFLVLLQGAQSVYIQVLMPSHLLSLLPQYQGFQVQLE